MSKNIQLVAWIAFIALVGGVLYFGVFGNNNDNQQTADRGETVAQQVEILKYSDYQCPACKQYIPLQNQLKRDFGDQLTIEYRHFPLDGFQYSRLAAYVVEAAARQGHKEEMHDMIFAGQEVWSQGNAEQIFRDYAEQIGLDMEQFEQDLQDEEIHQLVERQRNEGQRRLVQGTPTFFINGQRVRQNPQSYDQFRSLVEMHMYR